ncbi:MAG: hypothetical protein L3J76_04185 [Candidatus Hydrothermae bacterium]|nr:hypothetical protein [Candidatus Hydrothermae bacterium]
MKPDPIIIARRLWYDKASPPGDANTRIILGGVPLQVVRVEARIPWLSWVDPNNLPTEPLTSVLYINDFYPLLLTPEDVASGVPTLQWETLSVPFQAEEIRAYWELDLTTGKPWDFVQKALLEIRVLGIPVLTHHREWFLINMEHRGYRESDGDHGPRHGNPAGKD